MNSYLCGFFFSVIINEKKIKKRASPIKSSYLIIRTDLTSRDLSSRSSEVNSFPIRADQTDRREIEKKKTFSIHQFSLSGQNRRRDVIYGVHLAESERATRRFRPASRRRPGPEG